MHFLLLHIRHLPCSLSHPLVLSAFRFSPFFTVMYTKIRSSLLVHNRIQIRVNNQIRVIRVIRVPYVRSYFAHQTATELINISLTCFNN